MSYPTDRPESHHPIGIFDSGIGGLTVAHALVHQLPQENIIYFGDTAHLPYGDKSAAAIQAYAVKIAGLLLEKKCKLILIACHSASAAAYELVKEFVGDKAIVVSVIEPMIALLKAQYQQKNIGLIGTRHTVNSNIYKKKIELLKLDIKLSAVPTNLLAAAIEEFGRQPIIDELLRIYLQHPDLQNIDALILACTHYPIIKEKIKHYYTKPIDIIDPSEIVAKAVYKHLSDSNLINHADKSSRFFYVSDYTESFAAHAKLFFGEDIHLEHLPLWD